MKKSVKKEVFIQQPIYQGGPKAMQLFIQNNLIYPQEALENKVEGVTDVRISIDHEGHVTDTLILTSLTPKCDAEAIRLAKLLKFDVPKNPRKLKVLFHKNIKIQFRLPKVKKENNRINPPKITYTILNNVTEQKNADQPKVKEVYSYTLNLKG